MVTVSSVICNKDYAFLSCAMRSDRSAAAQYSNDQWTKAARRRSRAVAALKDAEMLTQVDAVVLQRCGRRGDRDAAGVENDDIVGNVEHEFRALLDEHDRQPAFLELADGR